MLSLIFDYRRITSQLPYLLRISSKKFDHVSRFQSNPGALQMTATMNSTRWKESFSYI
jgi:hypothetical protein